MKFDVQHAALLQYLRAKIEGADWTSVSNAANDLRVLEAQIALTPMTATEVIERQRPHVPFDWLCSCNQAGGCPLGRVASMSRCTAEELLAEVRRLRGLLDRAARPPSGFA